MSWARDLLLAVGLVFAFEGILLAGLTDALKKRWVAMAKVDDSRLRTAGLVAAAVGVALVWAAKMMA